MGIETAKVVAFVSWWTASASVLFRVLALMFCTMLGSMASAQVTPTPPAPIFPQSCEAPTQTSECAFKTWLACDVLNGSFCALVGVPVRDHDYGEDARQEHAVRIANDPVFAEVVTTAFRSPWILSVQDIISVSPFLRGEVEVAGPSKVNNDRMGRGAALPEFIDEAVEIMMYRGIVDDVWNYSVFLGQRDGQWRVLGWHRAYASFSMARFGDTLNPLTSEWIETCGLGYLDCINSGFVFGLMPYDVYQAMKK